MSIEMLIFGDALESFGCLKYLKMFLKHLVYPLFSHSVGWCYKNHYSYTLEYLKLALIVAKKKKPENFGDTWL